jgi:hypothetical protein
MVDLASTTKRVRAAFRKANVPNLALLFKLFQSFHRLLDWCFAVQAMSIVEVDVVDTQSFERFLTGLPCIFRAGIDMTIAYKCRVRMSVNANKKARSARVKDSSLILTRE